MILVRYLRKHGEIMWGSTELADGTPQIVVKMTKGRPYACVVATGKDIVGWSLCKKEDVFSKKEGVQQAIFEASRIAIGNGRTVPTCLKNEFDKMILRSQRYYKEEK